MFFGTPHRGILLEDVRKMLENESGHPRIDLLKEIGNALNLEPDLKKFINLAQGFKVVSFYERLQTAEIAKNSKNKFSRSGNYRSALDTDSALLHLPKNLEETIPVDADHTNMVKFEYKCGTYDDVVKRVRKYMETALDDVIEDIVRLIQDQVRASMPENLNTSFYDFRVQFTLPFHRNNCFFGRGDVLSRLEKILDPRHTAGNAGYSLEMGVNAQTTIRRKTVILHGMGGIGKSQIALKYAHRFSHCYTSIFLINVDDSIVTTDSACKIVDQIVSHYVAKSQYSPDYQKISNALGIPGKLDEFGKIKDNSAEIALKVAHTWLSLRGNRGWLLLVDNNDKAKVRELDKLIPGCDWGSILVTTRLPNLHKFGEYIEVDGIGAEAGLQLLLKSSGKNRRNLDNFEIGKAQEIVKALGELPLALDQAGVFISSLQRTSAAYRIKMKEGMKAIFNEELDEPSLSLYKASVRTTWELSFQELTDDARQLLQLCAFLNNEEISEDLFRGRKSAVPWIMDDESKLDNAIKMHTWARERKDTTVQRQNAEDALKLVASAIKFAEQDRIMGMPFNLVEFHRRNGSHIKFAQAYISEYCGGSDMSIAVAEALLAIASSYRHIWHQEEAEELYKKVLATYEKVPGRDHYSTLAIMIEMADNMRRWDRLDEALERYWKVLAGYERTLGDESYEAICIIHEMAHCFKLQKRYDEAHKCYQRALAVKEKKLGEDHLMALDVFCDMACCFTAQRRYDEALECYRSYLAKRNWRLGYDESMDIGIFFDEVMLFFGYLCLFALCRFFFYLFMSIQTLYFCQGRGTGVVLLGV
ncbi:hypothetical protein RUND412_006774 [Rhizina undulata]